MVEEFSRTTFEYLLTQGILGLTTMLASAVAVHFYRQTESIRSRYEKEMAALQASHDVTIAQERRLNNELQESRVSLLQASNESVYKANSVLENVILKGVVR